MVASRKTTHVQVTRSEGPLALGTPVALGRLANNCAQLAPSKDHDGYYGDEAHQDRTCNFVALVRGPHNAYGYPEDGDDQKGTNREQRAREQPESVLRRQPSHGILCDLASR